MMLLLPPSLLVLVLSYSTGLAAEQTATDPKLPHESPTPTSAATFVSTGSGPSWASSCFNAIASWSSASSSWNASNQIYSTTVSPVGGPSFLRTTDFVNATTLCDGFPRVTYSPAIPISTGWKTLPGIANSSTTVVETRWTGSIPDVPRCTIKPEDCDPLWLQYSQNVTAAATVTPAPSIPTPPCFNASADASLSSVMHGIYGCGKCTIFGEGVELVYFPTSATRDLCASTPTGVYGSLTHYGKGAVLEAYYGTEYRGNGTVNPGVPTAVVDGHTFTSGTAYISISKVWAVDRCSKTYGTPITDAILAMPTESVLSLRYRQNHVQALLETDKITGYPVSYADFNTPIPWSAWNAQVSCGVGPADSESCNVIYENGYRPQLAIPPEITSLSPDFEGCQMWYNGLWDPPLALTEYKSAAKPTLPNGGGAPKTSDPAAPTAAPSSAPPVPTSQPTALPNELPSSHDERPKSSPGSKSSGQATGESQPTLPNSSGGKQSVSGSKQSPSGPEQSSSGQQGGPSAGGDDHESQSSRRPSSESNPANTFVPSAEPWTERIIVNGREFDVRARNRQAIIGTVTCDVGGPAQTLGDGTVCTYGNNGFIVEVRTTIVFDHAGTVTSLAQQTAAPGSGGGIATAPNVISGPDATVTNDADTVTLTIGGATETIVQNEDNGVIVIDGSVTITPGGEPQTMPNGQVVSAGPDGLVYGSPITLGAEPTSSGSEPTSTGDDGAISGAIRSGLGYDDSDKGDSGSRTTSTGNQASQTGANGASATGGASLASFESFNIATVIAFMVAALAV